MNRIVRRFHSVRTNLMEEVLCSTLDRTKCRRPSPLQRSYTTPSSNNHFDTYRLVQRLEADGFTRDSSEAIMNSLSEVISESSNNLAKNSVARTDFEKTNYMNRMDLNQLKSEIHLLEKNDFALIRADIGRLNNEVEKLKVRMTEDLRRVQSNIRLELGLEKGRIRDHQSTQEIRIKETDSKIDAEVSQLKTQMETIQWDLFKTLFRKDYESFVLPGNVANQSIPV